ncbi:oocyte zinc finger protein XlCOF7.1-like [Dendropsophus ebraccatus]|uniref:oocyte zinc finger protein XlCOF7.1-like n=1 Tax=Dendropsophus ebraccatus TaxID=150705 RepID=UPI00383178CC
MVPHNDATERVLHLTLEIIYLLTGEDYGSLKNSAEAVTYDINSHLLRGLDKNQSSMLEPSPPIHEKNNEQKILDLANKIIELLTGEVPIRYQDVTVYFSMEEWEYIEGHKDLYKDIMMEERLSVTAPDNMEVVLSGRSMAIAKDGEHTTDNDIFAPTNQSQDPSHVNHEILCGEGHQDTEVCTATDHMDYVSFFIKEEGKSATAENPSDIATSSSYKETYPGHQLKAKPISYGGTPIDSDICSITDHITTHMEDGPLPYKGENLTNVCTPSVHPQQYSTSVKEGSHSSQRGQQSCIYVTQTHTQTSSTYMKEEAISCDEEELTDADIYRHSGRIQDQPLSIIEEDASCDEVNSISTDVYTPMSGHQRKNGLELWSKLDVFSCSECDKSFHCQSELLMHLPVHSGHKPYNCSICGKCFTNLSYLITHGKIHAGEKRYSCPDCGTSFTRSSNLKAHKRKHTGEKPYLCSDCGKCFSSNSNLNAHRKRHTGDKPYSCPDCGKSFISRSHLVVHQRTHTGEKPYTCPLCIKCFSNTSDLAKHQKIHNKKPYYCSKCGTCFKSNPDFDNRKLHICTS